MGRLHKTSHGPRKHRIVGYSIAAYPNGHYPELNVYGLPSGFKDNYPTKAEVQAAIAKLRKTKKYRSLKIVELKA